MKNWLMVGIVMLGMGSLAMAAAPSADDILRTARYVTTLKQTRLDGHIRKGKEKTPIALFLIEGQGIEFQVYESKTWKKFQMKLGDQEYDLFEGVGGKIKKFDTKKLNSAVMGTDLTYEDLALSFLYWPNGTVLGEENLGFQKDAWKVRLVNPAAKGRYKTVDVWVHQKSGALMKVQGYEASGKCVKRFQVTDLMNVGGGEYSLKRMKVESFGADERTSGQTYLEFKKPQRKPQGLR